MKLNRTHELLVYADNIDLFGKIIMPQRKIQKLCLDAYKEGWSRTEVPKLLHLVPPPVKILF
jgi:hypothetical protein